MSMCTVNLCIYAQCILLEYFCIGLGLCVRIQQRKCIFLLMPCLTRSALIKRSPKPMHLTDRNLLQKTAPEPSKHTRLPACKPFLQCKQTGIHLKHWQGIYTKCNPKKKIVTQFCPPTQKSNKNLICWKFDFSPHHLSLGKFKYSVFMLLFSVCRITSAFQKNPTILFVVL